MRHVTDALAHGSTYTPVTVVASVDFELLTSLVNDDSFARFRSIAELTNKVYLK